jgi:hypothetical protein
MTMIERIDKAIDKITNCTGIILFFCTIVLILSMMTAVYYIGVINRPNLNDAPVSFEYAAYNNNIELDNLANHTDKNEGKIGYITKVPGQEIYNYKLSFGEENDSVYIYPTLKQAKLLKRIGESKVPVLVEAKVIDTSDSDFYGIDIININSNESSYNVLCNRGQIAADAVKATVVVMLAILALNVVDYYRMG